VNSAANAFRADTGITVVLETVNAATLGERLIAEKQRATADLVIADGIANLWAAAEVDMLRPSHSDLLAENIPEELRDPENLWFGLLGFARTIAYDKRAIDPADLRGYEELGDKRWRGKLCLSSADHADNQALVAMMIAEHDNRPAELIARSWIANLALPVVADDATLFKEIEAARCGLGIVNSDDALRLARNDPHTAVELFWPTDASGGAYINVVAAAVTRHAGNPVGALRFLEWLSSERGQQQLAGQNPEYAVHSPLPIAHVNSTGLARAAFYREDAVLLMERASWKK
jgi:iron(III) transport system substrate-binding protein